MGLLAFERFPVSSSGNLTRKPLILPKIRNARTVGPVSFPVFFPVTREWRALRDGFAHDCLLQRGVRCELDTAVRRSTSGVFGTPRSVNSTAQMGAELQRPNTGASPNRWRGFFLRTLVATAATELGHKFWLPQKLQGNWRWTLVILNSFRIAGARCREAASVCPIPAAHNTDWIGSVGQPDSRCQALRPRSR